MPAFVLGGLRRSSLRLLLRRGRRLVGSAGNAPVRRFRFCFLTPDLQAGNRIASRKWLREWESHPPEEVYEASLCALVEFPAVN